MNTKTREIGFVVLQPVLLVISAIGLQRSTQAALAGKIGSFVQWILWAIIFSIALFGFYKSVIGYLQRALLARVKRRRIKAGDATSAHETSDSSDEEEPVPVRPKVLLSADDLLWVGLVLVVGGMDALSLFALQSSVRAIFSGHANIGWSVWQIAILTAAAYGLTTFTKFGLVALLDRTRRKRRKLAKKLLKLLKSGSRHAVVGAAGSTFATTLVVLTIVAASAATTWTPAWHGPHRSRAVALAAATPSATPSPTPNLGSTASPSPSATPKPTPTPTPTPTPSVKPSPTPTTIDHHPVAVADAVTTRSGRPVIVTVLANDTGLNDSPIVVSKVSGPSHGTVVPHSNNAWTYTSSGAYVGADSFVYRVCDAQSQCSSATVSITVLVNHTPVAVADNIATAPNTPISGNVLSNDTGLQDAPLKVTVTTSVGHGTLSLNNAGAFTYTPTSAYMGPDHFVYRVCDADNQCSSATASISVG